MSWQKCPICEGRKSVTADNNIFKSMVCKTCNGTGLIDSVTSEPAPTRIEKSVKIQKIIKNNIGGGREDD